MIKARSHDRDGNVFVLFGLSEGNVKHLYNKRPIFFQGTEIGLPAYGVLITWSENGEDTKRLHQYFAKKHSPLTILAFGLTAQVIERMKQNPIEVEGRLVGVDDITFNLMYGKTEEDIMQSLGHHEVVKPSVEYVQELDPLTGLLVAKKREPN